MELSPCLINTLCFLLSAWLQTSGKKSRNNFLKFCSLLSPHLACSLAVSGAEESRHGPWLASRKIRTSNTKAVPGSVLIMSFPTRAWRNLMGYMTGEEKKAVVTSLCLLCTGLTHHPATCNPVYAFVWVLWVLIKLSVHMKSMVPVFCTAATQSLVRLNIFM